MCSLHPRDERKFKVSSLELEADAFNQDVLFSFAHSLKQLNYFYGKKIHPHIQIIQWNPTAHERDHEIKGQKCVQWVK